MSSAHQVITGALNHGESMFANGSVEGINFTVCAVGTDVVILASNFERVQVIPGSCYGNESPLVSCVNCCVDSGKIAAAYGSIIRIFEPTHCDGLKAKHKLDYRWFETGTIQCKSAIADVFWNLEGLRLLVSTGSHLQLYQHRILSSYYSNGETKLTAVASVTFSITDDDNEEQQQQQQSKSQLPTTGINWISVWQVQLSAPVKYVKYSPDGALFSTCGIDDQLVKIWYQDSESEDQSNITFNFIYLRHPAAVVGFEWRKTGRYMPRRCIGNVLITWCKDNTSRIWKETPSNDCALDMNCDTIDESSSAGDVGTINRLKSPHRNVRIRNARHKILHRLKHLVTIKNKRATKKQHDNDVVVPLMLRTPSALIGSSGSSLLDVSSTGCCSFTRHFHLAATINAETDCFLVPSMDTKTAIDKPFAVHWLNNKELMFSLGAEKLLADALIAEQRLLPRGSIESLDDLNHKPICSFSTPLSMDNGDDIPVLSVEGVPISTSNTVGNSASSSSSDHVNKDILDMKMEGLLRQWLRANDVLFTVHPVDGSLLIWTLEWLDDMSRMPTVSFSSRIPSAFPLTDAASLNPTLHTFNPHDPIYVEVLHRNIDENDVAKESKRSVASTLFLLTSHENGSLNLWHLSMEDNSNFTIILNISHQSRMCGHRFQISQVVGHSVLPLLLTASQYDNGKKAIGGNSTTMVDECSSELILWKISPVGPLCKSGGVRELARVTSTHARRAFSCIAWIPAILPSSTLGSVCNSPSSCFVANDGRRLRVYQAVIDARALLAEIYAGSHARTTTSSRSSSSSTSGHEDENDLRTSSHIPWHEAFNVVSTQSTAKPGCVLQLAEINDTDNENMENVLLLHIFYERLIIAEDSMRWLGSESSRRIDAIVVDRSKSSVFADRYYIVLLKKTATNGTVLDMWSLDIASQPPHPINNARSNKSESRIDSSDNYYPSASPATPSAAQLYIGSEKICSQILALPDDVQVLSAVPAAGHLSSSSFYPACRAPYLLMTACTDDHVRFWRCLRNTNDVYQWQQWRMISNSVDSALEMDGHVFAVSAAHSSRFACAYERAGFVQKQPGHHHNHHQNIEVAVFECESSGGVEWTREDTLPLKDNIILASRQHHDEVDHNHHDTKCSITSPSSRIRIDWVSTENGSHLLTLNVGALVLFYAQVSQDMAQRNIVMMKEHDTHKRPALRKASSIATQRHSIAAARLVRWLCIRSLHLHSADGLPPLPTALTWVRDGLLIIGMQSEMRCYNQWNLQTISDNCTMMIDSHNPVVKRATLAVKPAALTFSPSHSMLDALRRDPSVQPPLVLMRKDKGDFASRTALQDTVRARDNRLVLEAVSDEGMFEAARLASPMLPQYHPKQLIELLNAGKNRRVKAILLHVLRCIRERCTSTSWSTAGAPTGIPNAMLARASSIRRMVSADESSNSLLSGAAAATIDDTTLDYFELESIPPLPLHALIAADSSSSVAIANSAVETDSGVGLVAGSPQTTSQYDSLFNDTPAGGADDLDAMLVDDEDENGQPISRSRHASTSSDHVSGSGGEIRNTVFTARHNRALTDFLTHMHLPGLSSVDQMHLLAVADTLSHFSSDIMDKLAQANAAMQPVTSSVINEATSGYATAGAGADTVDECGLRFLMAMKQHEYLLRCLPLKQRQALRTSGIAPSHIIWALHSETETELLNAIPGLQKSQPMWDELRSLGVGWWLLKNTTALRTCVEKMAKTAFQQHQNPLDAALFYLALRKKNVLTHLFRSARDERLSDFFAQDFSEERWRKAALKNAFLLMSKQRFHHAAAFFILGESLNDAIQVVLHNLNDLQLVLVIVRLYETDADRQTTLLRELLCRNILGIEVADLEANTSTADDDGMLESRALSASANPDPFIRSMAYWLLKEYSQAAATLLDEATRYHTGSNATSSSTMNEWTLSNIFNFYSFLRKHPLVIRQRLSDAHVQIGSTEKFLAAARRLESHVTPSERRLFFRTASAHLASGCPLLALDVLSRLPKALSSVAVAGSSTLSSLVDIIDGGASVKVDWSEPTNVIKEDKLELEWSDEEEDKTPIVPPPPPTTTTTAVVAGPLDVMAQHLKFVAVLRILTEELATFATGFEVDGGQLRYQLFSWLEREVQVLRYICDYQPNDPSDGDDASMMDDDEIDDQTTTDKRGSSDGETAMMLHEALRTDRLDLVARIRAAVHRRRWLAANQKLIRSLNSYCALHSSHSVGLVSAQMELSLLLLEVQQEPNIRQLIDQDDTELLTTNSVAATNHDDLPECIDNCEEKVHQILIDHMQSPVKYPFILSKMLSAYQWWTRPLAPGQTRRSGSAESDVDCSTMFGCRV